MAEKKCSLTFSILCLVAGAMILVMKPLSSDAMRYIFGASLMSSGITDIISALIVTLSTVLYRKKNSGYIYDCID